VPVLDRAVTEHWFDPCELLAGTALVVYRVVHRARLWNGGEPRLEQHVIEGNSALSTR
jgi:hypothetical protein